jgi:5'-nucleotidase
MSVLKRLLTTIAAALVGVTCVSGQVAIPAATDVVDVQLLAFNDFHGALEPPAGARMQNQDVGGVEFLTTHLRRLRDTNPNTFIVSAGDNIGGTPLLSSLMHDEATIEALNGAGLHLSAIGNHELDEGWWELLRMDRGGCHPVDGCQDGTPFAGAVFEYLAANITLDPARSDPAMLKLAGIAGTEPRLLFPASTVKTIGGVRIGFIGAVLDNPPVMAASLRGLIIGDEVAAANAAARALRQQGVNTIVLLIHEGGFTTGGDINTCGQPDAQLQALAAGLIDEIDVVVSGHTHWGLNCTIGSQLVTSAASNGRVITDIDLRIDRRTGRVVAKTATNVLVTRDVPRDPGQTALIAHYRPLAEEVGGRQVGTITASLLREPNAAGESALGDVIADAFLEAANRTPGAQAEFAFHNIGGIRADLLRPAGASGPSPVTFAQLFTVAPFGNIVTTKTLSGQGILDMLEQQFGATQTRIIQVSRGFTFAYDPSKPRGQKIDRASVRINGQPLVPTRQYRIATTDFLWTRGDGYDALGAGTEPVIVGADVDVLAEHFTRSSPVSPGPQDRIRLVR